MKIRTRIITISCVAIFIATILSEAIIWNINKKTQIDNALMQGYMNIMDTYMEIKNKLMILAEQERNSYSVISYLIKEKQDDYIIFAMALDNGDDNAGYEKKEYKDIYNNTAITATKLMNRDFQNSMDFQYSEMTYGTARYLIIAKEWGNNNDLMIYLYDVTEVYQKLYAIVYGMIAITVVIMLIAGIVIFFTIKGAFKPMDDLNKAAASIAGGNYEERIEIKQKDEIGILGESFNYMANAIESHTRYLEEMEHRKTLFMADLSHELRTPMTAIKGYAETLLTIKLEPEDEEEAIGYIYNESSRLERLAEKLMFLLKLEQGQGIVRQEHYIKDLFHGAVASCNSSLVNKDVQLLVSEHGEKMLMDLDLMTEVIINLIDNAIKASKEGNSIYLTAGTDEKGVYISVKDNGIGILEEEIDRILEPFYMVDKSRSRKTGGAGLGLALVAEILKQHEFVLQINSKMGSGTDVRIYNMFTKQ